MIKEKSDGVAGQRRDRDQEDRATGGIFERFEDVN